jgi:hypothetical protein
VLIDQFTILLRNQHLSNKLRKKTKNTQLNSMEGCNGQKRSSLERFTWIHLNTLTFSPSCTGKMQRGGATW